MIAPTPLLVGEFLDFPGFCSRRELIEYMDSRRPLSSNEGKKQETFTTSPVDKSRPRDERGRHAAASGAFSEGNFANLGDYDDQTLALDIHLRQSVFLKPEDGRADDARANTRAPCAFN